MENRDCCREIDTIDTLGLDLAHYSLAELESLLSDRCDEDECDSSKGSLSGIVLQCERPAVAETTRGADPKELSSRG
jgi:hypothetical protein